MKKVLALLLAMGLSLSMFTACGTDTKDAGDQTADTENGDAGNEENDADSAKDGTEAETEDDSAGDTAAAASEMEVTYSDAFSVKYLEDGSKLITDAENQQFLIVPEGTEAPAGYEDAVVLEGGAKNALFCSSTQIGMIAPLDIWDCVSGVTQEDGWPFEEVTNGLADGSITFVGDSYEPDFEAIQALNPDIVFVYTGTNAQTTIIEKLEELGIPYAVDNEYMEADYMGRMEWTKFLGSFFNKDEEAVAYVAAQEAAIADMQTAIAGAERPKVGWGMVYDGVVYVPNGGSYVAKQIEAAGGDYIFKDLEPDSTSSSQLSLEDFFDKMTEAEIWIYSSNQLYVPDYAALSELMPLADELKVVTDRNVWQFGVDYYFRTDLTEQQVIELARIFHPDLFEEAEFVHYNKLAE